MKKVNFITHKILKVGLIALLITLMASCETWIDPEMNIDPDAPGDVPMSLLIPGIQQNMGFVLLGNDVVRTTNIWVQIYDGVERQSHTHARYQLTSANVGNPWSSIYTEILMNAKILEEKAVEEESPYNAGVSKVMTAYTLAITSDVWGDIPYSDALQGGDNILKPLFDTQEQIYTSIFSLLDGAIADLSQDPANNLIDIDGDVIYGGDETAWLNAARAIKARAELQLSKKNGAAAYNNALALVDAFSSNGDDMEVPFEGSQPNPLYQFMEQRTDIRMCQTFLDELEATSDPRIPFYAAEDGDGNYTGSVPGGENAAASYPGDYQAAIDAPTVLISYAELKFIEAEAALQTGAAVRAAAAFKAGVAASILKVTGDANQDWLDTNIETVDENSITLEMIMMQKRHALASELQPYSDWRRTGIPNLSMAIGSTKTEIPRRYPYPQDEIIYNPNVPSIGSIIDPVWWDQ
ncbi:MAG: SusD/RagB family nutrient-binding outer membrane lipoprotein, partial [Bacteroidales bacterium]|nr:SusD/RagB family nutrient-binding outer membrane lipoprotein [Bacteroidales bacterium]